MAIELEVCDTLSGAYLAAMRILFPWLGHWEWSARRDLNPQQPAWRAGTLPVELLAHIKGFSRKVPLRGGVMNPVNRFGQTSLDLPVNPGKQTINKSRRSEIFEFLLNPVTRNGASSKVTRHVG